MPSGLVERLFTRLQAMYGNRLSVAWGDADPEDVKRVWGQALGAITPRELSRGIEGCMQLDWPPSLPEFVRLCTAKPEPRPAIHRPALPAPGRTYTQAKADAAIAQMRAILGGAR